MRRSQATRYARWSALTALLIVVVVTGMYARRAWQQAHALKKAPPAVPPSVTQRSATFAFSKVVGDRTLFTVRASRATEFKEGNKNLLEDVWITVYGRTGARFDNLHTQQCDYLRDTGRVVCKGEVQIDLESAEEAKQRFGVVGKTSRAEKLLIGERGRLDRSRRGGDGQRQRRKDERSEETKTHG